MAMGDKSAEIRAGIVVLIALVILGAGLFVVTGGWEQFRKKELYTIYFPDAGGIGTGDTVLLNGLRAGEVKKVEPDVPKRRDGKDMTYHAVTVELFAGSQIPVNSDFTISKTITNIATLSITRGDEKRMADESTDNLFGSRLATFEETVNSAKQKLDIAEDAIREFQGLASDARAKIKDLDLKRIQEKIEGVLETIQSAATELEGMIKNEEGALKQALGDLRVTAANLSQFSADLKRDWPEMEGKVQTILDNVTEASASLRAILDENRPGVRQLIRDASDRIPRLLETFEAAGKKANEALVELRPDLVRAVKTAAKALANFEAVTEDLKTAPWKLVNKPTGTESDEVHLYNAARLYIDAAARINENIEDLDTLRRLGVLEDPEQADTLARTLQILQQSLKEFEERERKLVALIQKRTGN